MVTISDTCKSHQETEVTKRLSWRRCYASLRGFCARGLVIWRPLSESFSSPFWYKRPERAAFLIHASDICRIILPECFAKCGSVNRWICPVLYSQACSPCTRIHQISVLFCRFGRDTLRAFLVFKFMSFHLAHIEQKFPKIKWVVIGVGFSWTALAGGALCLALFLSRFMFEQKYFSWQAF